MSSSWSWLNFRDFSSVAGNTATGIDTRPNEMAPFHIALGIAHLRKDARPPGEGARCPRFYPGPRHRSSMRLAATMPAMPRRSTGRAGRDAPRSKAAFTVDFPTALPVEREGPETWWIEVDGRRLRLTNLNKVFWP